MMNPDDMNPDDFSGDFFGNKDISFGASDRELSCAESAYSLGELFPGGFFQNCCNAFGDFLCGADMPGMSEIREDVTELADFFKMEQPRVFYEEGQLGVQSNGFTSAKDDNWIGGDPESLRQYSETYGSDFRSGTFAHEAAHNLLDCIGWEPGHSRCSNEAASDYLAGIYMGSKDLDPEGFATFLREEGNTGNFADYPSGGEREALFRQGYEEAHAYAFRDFQSVMDDVGFNLHGKLYNIAQNYD